MMSRLVAGAALVASARLALPPLAGPRTARS